MPKKVPEELLDANARWSQERTAAHPDYFRRLSALQAPEFLWIGCSDSRVPANVITGLEPGEVFVHRNVANIVYPADLNCMSVLQFAVETLKVKHIIVCGHYGCGGIRAVLDGSQHGPVEHWLAPVHDILRRHDRELSSLPSGEARADRLCEFNVLMQVDNVCESPILKAARERKQEIAVHGWIYRLTDGRLHDLTTIRPNAYRNRREAAVHPLFQNSPLGPDEIARMITAYEDVLNVLNLGDFGYAVKESVAKKIVECAQRGERDPKRMSAEVLAFLGVYHDPKERRL